MNRLEERWEQLGFSQRESKVYLCLLQLGPTTIGPLIRSTGLYRVIAYELLDKLMDKGLVSYFLRNGRRNFRAEDPIRLLEIAREKERQTEEMVNELQELRPAPLPEKQVLVYEKFSGIRAAQENYLKAMELGSKEEYLMFGASLQLHEKLDAFFNYFHEKRARFRIKARLLFNENNKEYGKLKKAHKPVEVRYMPENMITPSWISMFGDMMLIGVIDDEPFAFFIRNRKVVESYKKYFELLWKHGKP